VHALPAVAALHDAHPDAAIDWLVDRRNLEMVQLVPIVREAIVLERSSPAGWLEVIRRLRARPYDVAIDFQGLLKSAVLARASGARRVLGFSIWHLRERTARPFYSETAVPDGRHVIEKNLALVRGLGAGGGPWQFPIERSASPALDAVRASLGAEARFALLNPGAAWPNKCWPPDRFGRVAAFLRERYDLASVVLWGPGEEALARQVAGASSGAAIVAPATTITDLVELSRPAALMVSGDTGPVHIAGAVGTPIVSLFGPSDPARNGPWAPEDRRISRHETCACHYRRRCRRADWCLAGIDVDEVTRAIEERLSA
jgi:ADP-heptose:LPS heptosyltransferase